MQFNSNGLNFIDLGLGGELADIPEYGKFKVPSLRNVAVTAPYMHNGVFDAGVSPEFLQRPCCRLRRARSGR